MIDLLFWCVVGCYLYFAGKQAVRDYIDYQERQAFLKEIDSL